MMATSKVWWEVRHWWYNHVSGPLAAEAVHIRITLGTGWDGGKPTPAEEEFERLLALSDDELNAEIKEQG